MRKFIAAVATAAAALTAALAGATTASASTAKITLSGTVTCTPGGSGHYVEGVWMEVSSRTTDSNWAKMTATANTVNSTGYSRTFTTTLPATIRLHVGCGGTPQNWWSDNRTPTSKWAIGSINGTRSGLNARCNTGLSGGWPGGKPPASDNMRCSWGTYPNNNAVCEFGSTSGPSCINPANGNDKYDWGYSTSTGFNLYSSRGYGYRNCTDYAAWRVGSLTWSSFKFPPLKGNAKDWATYYANAGFTRSTTPRVGDIAVRTSGAFGHVGVVVGLNPLVVEDYNRAGTGADGLWNDSSDRYFAYYLHR